MWYIPLKLKIGDHVPGKIDEVRVYNRALSVEEVQQHYYSPPPEPGTTTLVYDGDGNRVKKTEGGETILYINQYYEKNITTSEETSHYYLGGKQIAYKKGSTLEYVHTDHLGSTSVTTNTSGTEVSTVRYFPFGNCRNSTGNLGFDKMFTGQRLDQTGLYFYNARYYDATIGRFISPDTIVPEPFNPQSLNRYSYCLNNPLRYIDPSGHQVEYMTYEEAHGYIVSYNATGELDLGEVLELHAMLTGILPEDYYTPQSQGGQGHIKSEDVQSAWVASWDYRVHLEDNLGDTAGAIDKAVKRSEVTRIQLGGSNLDISDISGVGKEVVGVIGEGLQAIDRQAQREISSGLHKAADIIRDVTAEDSLIVKYDPFGDTTHALGQWMADYLDREANRCEDNPLEFFALNAPVFGVSRTIWGAVLIIRTIYRATE